MLEAGQDGDQVVGGAQQPGGEKVVGGAAQRAAGPAPVLQLQHEGPHQAGDQGEEVGGGEDQHQHRELTVAELGPSEQHDGESDQVPTEAQDEEDWDQDDVQLIVWVLDKPLGVHTLIQQLLFPVRVIELIQIVEIENLVCSVRVPICRSVW